MDQEVMPGVGNVIKCEGLFNSKVHPKSISNQIPTDILHRLIHNLYRFAQDWYQKRKVHKGTVSYYYIDVNVRKNLEKSTIRYSQVCVWS